MSNLSVALEYARNGLQVVPLHGLKDGRCTCGEKNCARPGKHPRTEHGVEDATTDPSKIEELWAPCPKAKIAIATGASNVIAVSVTGLKGGVGWWQLRGESEAPPKTVTFRSGSSRILLFKVPPDEMPGGKAKLTKGVVVHGSGSLVVGPSSLESSEGERYFISGCGVGETEIARAPHWLMTHIRAHAVTEKSSPDVFATFFLDPAWIRVPNDPPCDPEKVKALTESIKITGTRMPPVVRLIRFQKSGKHWPKLVLLSDPHHLEAMKRIDEFHLKCMVLKCNKNDGRLWQIAELLHRPELTVLDWADLVMEWVRLVRKKAGQVAHPPGGRQPHDKGLSAAERNLGISRRDLARAQKIAGITSSAKREARVAKLDDIQRALLEIAEQPAGEQINKVIELKARYSTPRGGRPAASETTTPRVKADLVVYPDAVDADDTTPEQSDSESQSDKAEDDNTFARLKSRWPKYMGADWDNASPVVRMRFIAEVLGYHTFHVDEDDQGES
jgi:hypothetical protein